MSKVNVNVIGNIPMAMSKGAHGYDLVAAEDIEIQPNETKLIPTGTRIQIEDNNNEGMFSIATIAMPRSSLAKSSLLLANSVGLIDDDYTGDIGFMYWNRGSETKIVAAGTRIGQILFVATANQNLIDFHKVDEFTTVTERGEGGFGSTGAAV